VNLIADEEVVKEFIQKDFTPENLIKELKNMLEMDGYRAKIMRGYKKIRLLLGEQNASQNTAQEIYELLSAKRSEFN
jgi:lipid-A-disaccharide synthase